MRVLVACEFSGTVRRAFRALGHDAWSCDLLPAEDGSPYHYKEDVRNVLGSSYRWDLVIAHPPCQYLAVSGARWWKGREALQEEAARFFMMLYRYPAPRMAVENPIGAMSRIFRKPDQIIQPWQFGHGEVKATCLWLRGLPPLKPTRVVRGRYARVHREPPGPDRWKNRSRTYPGIATAMAEQWGDIKDYRALQAALARANEERERAIERYEEKRRDSHRMANDRDIATTLHQRANGEIERLKLTHAETLAAMMQDHQAQLERLRAEVAAAREQERERCLRAVASEPELPDEPPAAMVECVKENGWVEALRIAVRLTKTGIANRIRGLPPSPARPDQERNG